MSQINTKNKINFKRIGILLLTILAIMQIILIINKSKTKITKNETIFAQEIKQNTVLGKNYDISEIVSSTPNIPVISAGMIPVKWNGSKWVITTQNDSSWYDYADGKPAYMMLNDGTYQSEEQEDMSKKLLASNYIGKVIETKETIITMNTKGSYVRSKVTLGTIYAWIPRYAYSADGRTNIYIKQGCTIAGNYTIPSVFTYGDYNLGGVWIQIQSVGSNKLVNNLKKMQGEGNTYSFIANTIAESATSEYTRLMNLYNNTKIENRTNTTRAVIKVVNEKIIDPIKATMSFNEETKKVDIQVNYTANGIDKIIDMDGNILSTGETTVNTGDIKIYNETYKILIRDTIGNQKELSKNITGAKDLIDAKATFNEETQKIEINVLESKYKVKEILLDGQKLILTEDEGRKIKTDTGGIELENKDYTIKIIDEKNNVKTIIQDVQVMQKFMVAYTDGVDNINLATAYNYITSTDSMEIFTTTDGITKLQSSTRTSVDTKYYMYSKYEANSTIKYTWTESSSGSVKVSTNAGDRWGYYSVTTDANTGVVTGNRKNDKYSQKLNGSTSGTNYSATVYTPNSFLYSGSIENGTLGNGWGTGSSGTWSGGYYKWSNYKSGTATRTYYSRSSTTTYTKGDFKLNFIDKDGSHVLGTSTKIDTDGFWYTRGTVLPKYLLYKYDEEATLQSTYDVDNSTITTRELDISKSGNGKVNITISATGQDYKVYISNNNTNWTQVTNVVSGQKKVLGVDDWNTLYVKIVANTSTINSIYIEY